MRVFVTGATGFVGAELVRQLARSDHRVVGLARSKASAEKLRSLGAEVHEGDLADLDGLRRGALAADAVVHAAFDLDMADWAKGGESDRLAIEALGGALAGSDKLLVVTSGAFAIASSDVATEADAARSGGHPRVTEQAAADAAARGAKVAILRLGVVHGDGDRHFLPALIGLARAKGISAYAGDGNQRWPMVHVGDAAEVYRLALERGAPGAVYHAIAEQGVPFREIATVIARKLGIPLVAQSTGEAAAHFGVLAPFASADRPTSSARTREDLGWKPRQRGLLEDLEKGTYFAPSA